MLSWDYDKAKVARRAFEVSYAFMVDRNRRHLTIADIEAARVLLARAKTRRVNLTLEMKNVEGTIAEQEAILDRARREQEDRDNAANKV